MLNYLPSYLRKSKITQGIIHSEEQQFKQLDFKLEDIQKQILIDTATWAIPIYEKELKIIPVPNSTIEQRRAMIKAKWQSQSKIDKILLEAVATSILQTVVTVGFNGKIIFSFNPNGKIDRISQFYQAIDDIKPAHLPIELLAEIRSILLTSNTEYNFDVPYVVCNDFNTNEAKGIGVITNTEINVDEYEFAVEYPICNEFIAEEEVN